MNKIFTFFLILICLNAFAQNDYATINIYSPKAFSKSLWNFNIFVNGNKIGALKNGGHIEYKSFSKNLEISVAGVPPFLVSDVLVQLNLNVEKNVVYYFQLEFVGGARLEKLFEPISIKKLKKENYISASENDFSKNAFVNNHPTTNWDYESLIDHWAKNGISDIEGIYERVSAEIEYKLAVLKENNEYKIIYLAGANGTGWKKGDIKATLRKTAQFGIFKSNWYMLNKETNKDLNIIFENASMKTLSESGDNSQDLYLKMYPTYDDVANSKIVSQTKDSWKPSGTGFFIDRNGYIATNHHVIDEAKEIQININNKTYLAKVVISDERSDLAILKIIDNSFIPLTSINYNFNEEISEVGNSVFALGFPLTQYMGKEIKFTDGKINAKSGFKGDISTYQISVPIQPGNSGGPLFDNNGTLVGITSSGLDKSKTDNVNYAIKTKYLKLLIDEMTDIVELPKTLFPKTTLLTEKIKTLSNYVVCIKVK
ncbi:serine protease [Flavobacterium oreochromis]|uniref:S1C family serine protease n=1 Tax=Flavobacterium oreochromis TaxID=2906078 RepID=UPI00385F6DA6